MTSPDFPVIPTAPVPIAERSTARSNLSNLHSTTPYSEVGRRIDALVRTANVPVVRASSVLFESLAEVDQALQDTGRGVRHATT